MTTRRFDAAKFNVLTFSLISLILMFVTLLNSGCSLSSESASAADQSVSVEFMPVREQIYQDSTEVMAQINSKHSTDIHPQVTGRILRVLVSDGQTVQAGQALYQLDANQQSANVASLAATRLASMEQPRLLQKNIESLHSDLVGAQADLEFNRKQLSRYQQLLNDHTVSIKDTEQYQTAVLVQEQKVKSIQSNIASYQARKNEALANISRDTSILQSASVNLSYFTVRAPFTGTIGTLLAKEGDVVDPMTVLTTLTDNRNLEVDVAVSADERHRIHMGMPMSLLTMQNEPLGEIKTTYIAPKVDPLTQTFLIKAKALNSQNSMAMDQHLKVQLHWGELKGILIPVVSVFHMDGAAFVYRVDAQKKPQVAHMHPVKLGAIIGENVVILSGLRAGDTIVKSGIQKLQEGTPVAQAQALPAVHQSALKQE
jgi:multidrug efflux pump subunit AcrA (membrane-fusion protein)